MMFKFSPIGFLVYPSLLMLCEEESIKIEVIEEFVSSVLRVFNY